jgi:hypothetical protein
MQRTQSGRPALSRRTAIMAALALACAAALITAVDPAGAANAQAGSAAAITVRVEGPSSTLLPASAVSLTSAKVSKNGVPADSCAGTSAAGALQAATHGDWNGTWSSSYKSYFLTSIEGVGFPASGAAYWAFWVNDAPSAEGICGYAPKPGDSLLFFPDCYGKSCPPNAGVLGLKAPAVAVVGTPFKVSVTAYSDAKGAPSKAVGATVSAGAVTARTGSAGTATLKLTHAGTLTLEVTAPHAVRDEARICVEAAASKTCG